MREPEASRRIRLDTAHFVLRTVEPEDVSLRWTAWLADPSKTRTLNAMPMALCIEDIRKYLDGFDQRKAHILGIFERSSGAMIGFWEVYVDWTYREFLINVLIGERGRSSLRARVETQQVLHAYFFGALGLEAMRCSVLSANPLIVRVLVEIGAVHEHTSQKPSAFGSAMVEILHFRLSKDEWAIARARRLARELAVPHQSEATRTLMRS
jgi:RimJ/RimL family protein N-acetyltransferase